VIGTDCIGTCKSNVGRRTDAHREDCHNEPLGLNKFQIRNHRKDDRIKSLDI
jgi:hypothetical protein